METQRGPWKLNLSAMLGQEPEGEVGSDRWLQHTGQVRPWLPGLCDATVPENAAGEPAWGISTVQQPVQAGYCPTW